MKIRREQKPHWKDRPRPSGYEVIIPAGDDAMKHYKRLKKRMIKDGFFQELKDRQYFITKSLKKQNAKKKAKIEWARKQKLLELNF